MKFKCTGKIFPPNRDRFMSLIFAVLSSKKFSETIDTGNCAHGHLRDWKSNMLN